MDIIQLVIEVQRMGNGAGLAINMVKPEEAKLKLCDLFNLLTANVDVLGIAEPDKVEEPDEPETPEREEPVEKTPTGPGPEAEPSEQ